MRRETEKESNKIKMQNAKLRNNAIIGKSFENPMNKADIKIVKKNSKQHLKWSFRSTFKGEKLFHNGAIAIKEGKCRINLNKPIYIGTSRLDLSKVLIQDFNYNCIEIKYDDKAKMFLTDSDSLMYKIETENVYVEN